MAETIARDAKPPKPDEKTVAIPAPCGLFSLKADILAKRTTLAQQLAPDGTNLLTYLGYPLADSSPVPGQPDTVAALFQRGMIVSRTGLASPAVMYGALYVHFQRLGGVASSLGLPTGDIRKTPDAAGLMLQLDAGDIYWRQDLVAAEVHGAIRARWLALGGVTSYLGYPISDEVDVVGADPDGGVVSIGRMSRFEHGTIFWSARTGACDVEDNTCKEYESSFGGPRGFLGFPVGGTISAGSITYIDCENGTIVTRTESTGATTTNCFATLIARLVRVMGRHGGWTGGRDVYLRVDLTVIERHVEGDVVHDALLQHIQVRLPADNDYGENSGELNVDFLRVPLMRGGTRIEGTIECWDSAATGSDELLSTYEISRTAENLWGIYDPEPTWRGDGLADFHTLAPLPVDLDQIRRDLFWPFTNYGVANLSWLKYSETFTDVAPDEISEIHPINDLFYHLFYDGLAENGFCMGMCLEAIYARVGRSLIAPPLQRVGASQPQVGSVALEECLTKHGYQIGDRSILWILERFFSGDLHDPNSAYEDSRQCYADSDYPVLCLSSGYFAGGHVVMPYAWIDAEDGGRDEQGRPCNVIRVANPNFPWPAEADDGAHSVIYIYPETNSFRFLMKDNDWWEGAGWSGGRLFVIPYRVLACEPSTPFWEVVELAALGLWVVFAGEGTSGVVQVEDVEGRKYYRENVVGRAAKWEDVNESPTARPPGLMQVSTFNTVTRPGRSAFVSGQQSTGLRFAVVGDGTEYHWGAKTPHMAATVRGNTSVHGHDDLIVGNNGNEYVEVRSSLGAPPRTIEIDVWGSTGIIGDRPRGAFVRNATLGPGGAIRLSVVQCGKRVRVENTGQTNLTLEVGFMREVGRGAGQRGNVIELGPGQSASTE